MNTFGKWSAVLLLSSSTILANTENIISPAKNKGSNKPVSVETDFYTIKINPQGAEITQFLHKDTVNELRNNVKLTDPDPYPMQLYWSPENREKFRTARFNLQVTENDPFIVVTATLPVTMPGNNRGLLKKIFTFQKNQHYWRFQYALENQSNKEINVGNSYFYSNTRIGPQVNTDTPRSAQAFYNFFQNKEDFEVLYSEGGMGCGSDGQENKSVPGPIQFFGMSSRFMVHAIIPLFSNELLYYFPEYKLGESNSVGAQMHLQLPAFKIPAKSSYDLEFILYTGPKVRDYVDISSKELQENPALKDINPDLYKGFDFGITAPIRDLIVVLLSYLYLIVPNYGVGIIIFAILFKLAFFPLNQKQAESMKKMQVLQPQIQKINEKYKDKPQEKQRKLIEVYKVNKVNPVGGCLPILVQIPVFIALYSAFSDAYELWKAPFIMGWIPDLSEPDIFFSFSEDLPLVGGFAVHLLPLLMTISQFLQTKFSMVSTDPNQKIIMYMMPFMLLFFFWKMPAGVVLYWTIQNLLSVAQQIYTNTKKSDDVVPSKG